MKKKLAFIVIYLLVCLAPLVTVGMSKDTSASEKRESAEFPKAVNEGKLNTEYFTQFDAWFSDHMGGRSFLVKAQTAMKETLFGESAESSVILGKNGWLFYGKTADDYCHVRTMTDRNIDNAAQTLSMLQTYCSEHGAEFVFTVAPNKNTLYADNMPARYTKADGRSNLEALTAKLYDYGVRYADLAMAFRIQEKVLYQPRDSHWTYEGAMVAYRTILDRLTSEHDLFPETQFTERNDWDADLANMIYPDAADDDAQTYPNINYTFTTKGDAVFDEALVIETLGGAGTGTLLMFRDSFGNTMWRYFAQGFSKAEFQRAVPYRMSSVQRIGADTVILEIVERNLINLVEKAPLMEAPKAELAMIDAVDMSEANNLMATETVTGYNHVYGTIDADWLGESYHAYIAVNENGHNVFYEAFPAYERELLGTEETGDNGYSAYLPEDVTDDRLVGLVVETNGHFYFAPRSAVK
ncbi:MAG: hypothetical protein J6Y67_03350 [Lachnospiraceae bacterium]|nr:hypothetical protein [Lachnospiraceae bacterium]